MKILFRPVITRDNAKIYLDAVVVLCLDDI